MKFDELYPSKYISASDLPGGEEWVAVRIVGFDTHEVRDFRNPGRNKDLHVIHLKGWEKPLVLKKVIGEPLCSLFGTREMDDWIGRRFGIYATTVNVGGTTKPAIRVAPQLPPEEPEPNHGAERDVRLIGDVGEKALLVFMNKHDKSWDGFVDYLREEIGDEEAIAAALGQEIRDVPRWVLQKHFPKAYAVLPAPPK